MLWKPRERIRLRLESWCVYVHCIFNYVTDYLHETILLSCVLLSSCHFICFILFSNRLIDEHSRDHYRELTKEQNLGFDEYHLKIIDTLRATLAARFPAGFQAFSPGTKSTQKLSTARNTSTFGSLLGRGLRPVGANFPRGIAPDLQTPGSAPRLRLPVPHLVRAGEAPPPPPADLPLRRRICSFSSAIDSGSTTTSTSASGESTSIPFSLASARVCPLAHLFCRSCGGRLQP